MHTQQDWHEQDTSEFIELGDYFVPDRKTQTGVVTSVITPPQGTAQMLDVCCGQGNLSEALLDSFPNTSVIGLDRSPVMLETAQRRLAAYGERFIAEQFDLVGGAWRKRTQGPAAVVSSLAIHHLDGKEKCELYRDVHAMLRPGGNFVIADLIQPVGKRGLELARTMWDDSVHAQSLHETGDVNPYEKFHSLEWSCFEYPDDLDKPSPILDQLIWLREAGFTEVDLYWMKAGHAVFGGTKPHT